MPDACFAEAASRNNMSRRRNQEPPIGPLVGLIFIGVFFFGTVILAFLKVLLFYTIICLLAALVIAALAATGYLFYKKRLNLAPYLPKINWTPPALGSLPLPDEIEYPEFTFNQEQMPGHVLGQSGAWKAVLHELTPYQSFSTIGSPNDLQVCIKSIQQELPIIKEKAQQRADDRAQLLKPEIDETSSRARDTVTGFLKQIEEHLDRLGRSIKWLENKGFWGRLRADKLRKLYTEYQYKLIQTRRALTVQLSNFEGELQSSQHIEDRHAKIEAKIDSMVSHLLEVAGSKNMAGAIAELAVIQALKQLPGSCLVINDLNLKAPRFIHNNGKPIQSAQIDTLVITPAGVFIIEVKNWSKSFSESGDGFSPYEQVSRAGYLTTVILQESGLAIKVRTIVTSMGSLPEKGDEFVAVKPIYGLAGYINWFPLAGVDAQKTKAALLCYGSFTEPSTQGLPF